MECSLKMNQRSKSQKVSRNRCISSGHRSIYRCTSTRGTQNFELWVRWMANHWVQSFPQLSNCRLRQLLSPLCFVSSAQLSQVHLRWLFNYCALLLLFLPKAIRTPFFLVKLPVRELVCANIRCISHDTVLVDIYLHLLITGKQICLLL